MAAMAPAHEQTSGSATDLPLVLLEQWLPARAVGIECRREHQFMSPAVDQCHVGRTAAGDCQRLIRRLIADEPAPQDAPR